MVDRDCAEWAIRFMERVLEAWDYDTYRDWVKGERGHTAEEVKAIDEG